MQLFHGTNKGAFKAFVEPVCQQIVIKFLQQLGYYDFFKDDIYYYSNLTGGSKTKNKAKQPKLQDNRVGCKLNYDLNPRHIQQTGVILNSSNFGTGVYSLSDRFPIFADQQHGIDLIGQFAPVKLSMDVVLAFVDPAEALQAMQLLYNVYGNNETKVVLPIAWDMPIPKDILIVLFTLYKMTGNDPKLFYRYLKDHSNNSICFDSDWKGERKELVIKNSNVEINTYVTFDQERAEANMSGQTANNFKLAVKLETIVTFTNTLYIRFHETINNQLIPASLWPAVSKENSKYLSPSWPCKSFQEYTARQHWTAKDLWDDKVDFSKAYLNNVEDHEYQDGFLMKEPWWDKFDITHTYGYLGHETNYDSFFSIIFTLDDGEETIIDLSGDLNGIKLTDNSLGLINQYGEKIFEPTAQPDLLITVFCGVCTLDPSCLSIDGTTMRIKNTDSYKTHRLVLSKVKKPTYGSYITTWYIDIYVNSEEVK
ncbi:MAG: hypothetical protein GY804_09340 [Alphaproteobacteria bacterium]|nr:hypothetical protein [Alphaproteobacteria bacterium]